MKEATIAMIVVTFGTFINSVGLTCFKLSHNKSEKENRNQYLTPQFIFGFGLIVIASTINVVSIASADIVTLSSTASFPIIFNCILATCLLGEQFTRFDLLSILFIIAGASICVILSNIKGMDLSTEEVIDLYISTRSILSFALSYLIVVVSLFVANKIIKFS